MQLLPSLSRLVLVAVICQFAAQATAYDQGYGLSSLQYLDGILAIESPEGLFVGSSDRNYALIDESLEKYDWEAISVNDYRLAIATTENGTKLTSFDALDDEQRKLLSDKVHEYLSNLDKLNISVSGLRPNSYYQYDYQSIATGGVGWASPSLYASPVLQTGYGPLGYKPKRLLPSRLPIFSYLNLAASPLKDQLSGDIYTFSQGNPSEILDVFTLNATVKQRPRDFSLLFRNETFFSYSRINLPAKISRIFVRGDLSVFVFKDRSVLAELISNQYPEEQNLISYVQHSIKALLGHLGVESDYSYEDYYGKENDHTSEHYDKKEEKNSHSVKDEGIKDKIVGKLEDHEHKIEDLKTLAKDALETKVESIEKIVGS